METLKKEVQGWKGLSKRSPVVLECAYSRNSEANVLYNAGGGMAAKWGRKEMQRVRVEGENHCGEWGWMSTWE